MKGQNAIQIIYRVRWKRDFLETAVENQHITVILGVRHSTLPHVFGWLNANELSARVSFGGEVQEGPPRSAPYIQNDLAVVCERNKRPRLFRRATPAGLQV